jgi:DNA polymerase-4
LRDKGLRGRTVTLKARFSDFRTVTRTKTLDFATNLGPRLYTVAQELLDRVERRPLRLLGIQVSKLEDVRQPAQGTLFGAVEEENSRDEWMESNKKLSAATESLDKLRKRFGKGAVRPASLLYRDEMKGRDGSGGQPGAAGRAPEPDD